MEDASPVVPSKPVARSSAAGPFESALSESGELGGPSSPPTFRPTRRQALGRGLYVGGLVALVAVSAAVLAHAALVWQQAAAPPAWLWPMLAFGPPAIGAVAGPLVGRRTGTQICARGIRTRSAFGRVTGVDGLAPWSRVVDMRAERRGGRTVVTVYLDSGANVQLQAPYSGGWFAADPQFEVKMFALSYMWRSHRFGGLPG